MMNYLSPNIVLEVPLSPEKQLTLSQPTNMPVNMLIISTSVKMNNSLIF